MKMLDNNEINFTLIKDPESSNCTKYIDVIYKYLQGLVEAKIEN